MFPSSPWLLALTLAQVKFCGRRQGGQLDSCLALVLSIDFV